MPLAVDIAGLRGVRTHGFASFLFWRSCFRRHAVRRVPTMYALPEQR
ncbi:hypothetical protein CVCC1112_456 [Paenarthrobacter nicotinovorans]|nr:hypothetical protein CVCC1112_456 [Paenarthrobacter nicotinovorans]